MPMLIVSAVYPGASPDDVDQLVISKIEDEIGTLSGVDSVTSMSSENFGMVLVQYDYDQDIDKAYDDLKKKMDALVMRELYTQYKTAPTEEEKEKARREYLDRRGVPDSFRW